VLLARGAPPPAPARARPGAAAAPRPRAGRPASGASARPSIGTTFALSFMPAPPGPPLASSRPLLLRPPGRLRVAVLEVGGEGVPARVPGLEAEDAPGLLAVRDEREARVVDEAARRLPHPGSPPQLGDRVGDEVRDGHGELVREVQRGQERDRAARHHVDHPEGPARAPRPPRRARRRGAGAARAGRSRGGPGPPAWRRCGCRRCGPPARGGREAQHAHPEPGVAPGEREGVLLRLHLVPHPGQPRAGVGPGLLGEEGRVLPPRPVDRGERPQHEVPHAGRRRRGRREVQRADRLELVRVGGVPARGGEEGGVEDRVHVLLAEHVEEPLVGPGQGEVHHAVAHALQRGRGAAMSTPPPSRSPAPRPAGAGPGCRGRTRSR
jgi:hypothetical protein